MGGSLADNGMNLRKEREAAGPEQGGREGMREGSRLRTVAKDLLIT